MEAVDFTSHTFIDVSPYAYSSTLFHTVANVSEEEVAACTEYSAAIPKHMPAHAYASDFVKLGNVEKACSSLTCEPIDPMTGSRQKMRDDVQKGMLGLLHM